MANVQTVCGSERDAVGNADRALIAFAALLLAIAAVFHEALFSMARQWFSSSVYHHGVVVAPISLWLIARREDRPTFTPDRAGLAALLPALLLWIVSRAASVDLLGHIAVVLAVIAVTILVFGRAFAWRSAFALGFLFFMVPFGEELTPLLQDLAARSVAGALNLIGVETLREGVMLTVGAYRFEMEPSCAGLRFLLAALMLSALVSHLAFTNLRKRAFFIAAALVVALIANWLRAFLIVLIASATDRRIGVGPEHVILGWVFYSALVIAMIAIARRYQDAPAQTAPVNPARAPRDDRRALFAAALLIGAFAVWDLTIVSPVRASAPVSRLTASGYLAIDAAESWRPQAPGAQNTDTTFFADGARVITLAQAHFNADRRGAEIAGADVRAADGAHWRRLSTSRAQVRLAGKDASARFDLIENADGDRLVAARLYRLGDRLIASPVTLKLEIAARRLTGRTSEGDAIFIAAPPTDAANAISAPQLTRFIDALSLAPED